MGLASREQFVYIPNYVDAQQFTPQTTPGNYYLYFGRLAPEKGVGTLITAAAKAKVTLKLQAPARSKNHCKHLMPALGTPLNFGFSSRCRTSSISSKQPRRRFTFRMVRECPMSVLESMAMGKPVIGAQIGGIPELITADTGWTYTSGSVEQLTDLLAEVDLQSNERLTDIGVSARELVEKNLVRSGMWIQYTLFIETLLNKLFIIFFLWVKRHEKRSS